MNINNLFIAMLLMPAASLMASEPSANSEAQYMAAEQQQYIAIQQQHAAFMAALQSKIALKKEAASLTEKLAARQGEQARLEATIAELKKIKTDDQARIDALQQSLNARDAELAQEITELNTLRFQLAGKNKHLSRLIDVIEKLTGLQFPQSETGEYEFEALKNYFKSIEDFVRQFAALKQGYELLHKHAEKIVMSQAPKTPSLLDQLRQKNLKDTTIESTIKALGYIRLQSSTIDANLQSLEQTKATLAKKRPASSQGQAAGDPAAKRDCKRS